MKNQNFIFPIILSLITIMGLTNTSCKKNTLSADTIQGYFATITTTVCTDISSVSVTTGGTILSDGDNPVTQRGVCWSTKPYPTIDDSFTKDNFGNGAFQSKINSLEPNTTYFLRAYAINKKGISYGLQETFKTRELRLGDFYQGGTIFYINKSTDLDFQSGYTTGLVSNGMMPNIQKKWGCTGLLIDSTQSSIGVGFRNTERIVNKCNDTNSAAVYCNKLVLNNTKGWFLPSVDELQECQNFFNLKNNWYWSSMEFGKDDAIAMINGKISSGSYITKELSANIVPIKKFKTN